jgi:hypothetical protein
LPGAGGVPHAGGALQGAGTLPGADALHGTGALPGAGGAPQAGAVQQESGNPPGPDAAQKCTETQESGTLLESPAMPEDVAFPGSDHKPYPLSTERTTALFAELAPLLKTANTECLNFLDDLYEIPGCEELVSQMEEFNFDQAYAILSAISNNTLRHV